MSSIANESSLAAARRIANLVGFSPEDLMSVPSATNNVFISTRANCVIRVAPLGTSLQQLQVQLCLMQHLVDVGVPVVNPMFPHPIDDGTGMMGTLWKFIPGGQPQVANLDWFALGKILRRFQAESLLLVRRHEIQIPWVFDFALLNQSLNAVFVSHNITNSEHKLLKEMLAAIHAEYELLASNDAEPIIAHGDFKLDNVLNSPDGLVLCDPDSIGWAPMGWDEAWLVVQGLERSLSTRHLTRFSEGYGQGLDTGPSAIIMQLIRFLKWSVWLAERRYDSPDMAKRFDLWVTRWTRLAAQGIWEGDMYRFCPDVIVRTDCNMSKPLSLSI